MSATSAPAAKALLGVALFLADSETALRWRAQLQARPHAPALVAVSSHGGEAFVPLLESLEPRVALALREPDPAVAKELARRKIALVVTSDPDEALRRLPRGGAPEAAARLQLRYDDFLGARVSAAKDPALYLEAVRRDTDRWRTIEAAEAARAWLVAGRARLRVGDDAGAAEDFRRALPAKEAELGLAQALRDRPEEALGHAEAAGAKELAEEIRRDLGGTFDARGAAAKASAAAFSAPAWCRAAAHRRAATLWLQAGDDLEAARDLRAALAANADDAEAVAALVELKRRAPAAAAAAPRAAPAKVRPMPPTVVDRVEALRARKRPLEAAAAARGALDEVETLPEWQRADAYRMIAKAWLALGYPWIAARLIRESEDLDQLSLETALVLKSVTDYWTRLDDPEGPQSKQLAELDRDIAWKRAELARRRAELDDATATSAPAPR